MVPVATFPVLGIRISTPTRIGSKKCHFTTFLQFLFQDMKFVTWNLGFFIEATAPFIKQIVDESRIKYRLCYFPTYMSLIIMRQGGGQKEQSWVFCDSNKTHTYSNVNSTFSKNLFSNKAEMIESRRKSFSIFLTDFENHNKRKLAKTRISSSQRKYLCIYLLYSTCRTFLKLWVPI